MINFLGISDWNEGSARSVGPTIEPPVFTVSAGFMATAGSLLCSTGEGGERGDIGFSAGGGVLLP